MATSQAVATRRFVVPLSALTAGFVTVLVGFTSSVAIVFQAASAAGASAAEVSSWIAALGVAMGVSCIGLSLYYRKPVVTAWSTPGAALLATSLVGVPMSAALGAFVVCGLLILLCGVTGWFEKAIDHIPLPVAAAMLAGVLVRFGMNVFTAMQVNAVLVLAMFVAWLLLKRLSPRYCVPGVLLLGVAIAAVQGKLNWAGLHLAVARPMWITPSFDIATVIGVAVPLFVVTMASQNVPGVAVMRGAGYDTPVSPLISWTGVLTAVLAPFGCFSVNLAAISAAICMGREAHEDPAQRYQAAVAAGVFYLIAGLFGATIAALFAAFPHELVLAIAGIALFGTIGNSLSNALREERMREPALITFLVTASGVTLLGIGAAFWGLVAGALTLLLNRWRA
ncbi:benzoate/H(+) symporter BenE family transporter [Amantichitinum ursilacus]|uniref:Inner membrane protein YdcO n=1 Tax=Amantichitinum ursilacus TaxID=857265 RepID=A0A0N0GND8_9NEIS|nr:benzoate/H(+) symporter BenE family transporter [Amantichitinum ursilacus]KPC52625.1 Inner membrane protein YdcO [Amantichitinum ursilacus]